MDTPAEATVFNKVLFYNTSECSSPREESRTHSNMVVAEDEKEVGNDGMRDPLGHRHSAKLDVEKHGVKLGGGCLLGELCYIQALEDLSESDDRLVEHIVWYRCLLQRGMPDGTKLVYGYREHTDDGNLGKGADIPELPTHL